MLVAPLVPINPPLHQAPAFFVIRAKRNTKLRRLYSSPIDKTAGVRSDQTVVFANYYAARDYPTQLRRIRYYDAQNDRYLIFLTNSFKLPAALIAELYRRRWHIELFFKWIKQHLRIKAFYGTSENAVKIQIWTAISVYVLVAIIKKQLKLDMSLYQILQILSIQLLDKTPLSQALSLVKEHFPNTKNPNQLYLFK
jgi:IS4 transposase